MLTLPLTLPLTLTPNPDPNPNQECFDVLRWAVDFPLALVAYGATPMTLTLTLTLTRTTLS